VAVCAQPLADHVLRPLDDLPSHHGVLMAEIAASRLLGLMPLATNPAVEESATALAAAMRALDLEVALSAPRRELAALHEALREAELLLELAISPDAALSAQEETYRLLIGVLLRDPDELEQLRARTISRLVAYDYEHDTELVATLQAFLLHHGSTTETAEAMSLHRHTVGYRLARVHEVSGLSPYESDGRERLSLGLKADQILAADLRRIQQR
jgi:purine catabolism regulator